MDRATRCVLSWDGVAERTSESLQAYLERAPQAKQYYSYAFPVYDTLYYGAPYELRPDKQETYSVEAVNADLRHYLNRLARRSRCFSRRLHALLQNIRLFVYCYNPRQLSKRQFPTYPFHLVDFLFVPFLDTRHFLHQQFCFWFNDIIFALNLRSLVCSRIHLVKKK